MDGKVKSTRETRVWIAKELMCRIDRCSDADEVIDLAQGIADWIENGDNAIGPFVAYADDACQDLRETLDKELSSIARELKVLFSADTRTAFFAACETMFKEIRQVKRFAAGHNATFDIEGAEFGIRESAQPETETEGTAEVTQEPALNTVAMPVGECLGIARCAPDRFNVAIGSESIDLSGRQLLELKAVIQTVLDSNASAGYIVRAA